MATATGARYTSSIHDYPEHLNPFHEDENEYKKKFWTLGRKMNRSNSVSFPGIKDLKNSWALRSFMRKGKKKEQLPSPIIVRTEAKKSGGDTSPIVYRRALQSSLGSPSTASDRYVYGGSMTPLPRSRYDESYHSLSPHNQSFLSVSPRLAHSEVSGSRCSADSTNPFEDAPPVRPARSYRRKKRHAPAPPHDLSMTSDANTTLQSEIDDYVQNGENELSVEQTALDIELKIVEDDEIKLKNETRPSETNNNNLKNIQKEDIFDKISFPKVDIAKYRRNSSLNENEIQLRRGNLEDYPIISNKRSMSLNVSELHYIDDDTKNGNNIEYNNNNHVQKVVCRIYDENIIDNNDNKLTKNYDKLNEIEKATIELEKEISKLNNAFLEEDSSSVTNKDDTCLTFHEIQNKFNKSCVTSPNPIPKPKRSNCGIQSENSINTS